MLGERVKVDWNVLVRVDWISKRNHAAGSYTLDVLHGVLRTIEARSGRKDGGAPLLSWSVWPDGRPGGRVRYDNGRESADPALVLWNRLLSHKLEQLWYRPQIDYGGTMHRDIPHKRETGATRRPRFLTCSHLLTPCARRTSPVVKRCTADARRLRRLGALSPRSPRPHSK